MAAAPGGWVTVAEGEVTDDVAPAADVAPAGLVPPEAVGAAPCPGPIFPATKAPAPTEASTPAAASRPSAHGHRRPAVPGRHGRCYRPVEARFRLRCRLAPVALRVRELLVI